MVPAAKSQGFTMRESPKISSSTVTDRHAAGHMCTSTEALGNLPAKVRTPNGSHYEAVTIIYIYTNYKGAVTLDKPASQEHDSAIQEPMS
jgi:hypothetical protein